MTLADLPVLNPSTPGKEARRAILVAVLFAVFGVLYALVRAAALAPQDPASATSDVFGFAYPAGWGISPAFWSGAALWPTRIASGDLGTPLAVAANLVMVIALIIVMYPDILARQGPQYVSPARRILTVVIAFVLAFLMYRGVNQIDDIFGSDIGQNPAAARRALFGLAAIAAILFGGVWSFIGPKDFGRRIPLRISHGALGGIALWASVSLATILSSQPRAFISSSLDTFYSLLTIDAAAGHPGATLAWAVGTDPRTRQPPRRRDRLPGAGGVPPRDRGHHLVADEGTRRRRARVRRPGPRPRRHRADPHPGAPHRPQDRDP
jgi:hypothetical protein